MAMLQSNYTAVLKEIVLPLIQDNFPTQKIALNQLKRNAGVQPINNAFQAALRTSRHGGITTLANDGNNINASDGATFTRGSVTVKQHTGAFNISKLVMDSTQGDRMAIKQAFVEQAKTLVDDFGRDLNRQFYGDASGIVGQVAGSASGTSVTLKALDSASADDGRAVDYYGTVNRDLDAAEYLYKGMIVGVGTNAAALGTISSVSPAGATASGTVNFTGIVASAANDVVSILDGSGQGIGSAQMNGIRDALSSTTGASTYAGVARNTEGWTPQFGSAAEALSLDRMELAYIAARKYARDGDRYAIFVNKTLYKKYGQLLTAMRREVNRTELTGGWTGLDFAAGAGQVGVFLDYQVPDGEMIILNLDTWTLCQISDMNWVEEGQDALLRLQNTLTFQAVLVWYANVMCLAPAANARETQKTS